MTKDFLVYIETKDNTPIKGSLEVLSKAHELSRKLNSKVIAVVIGANIDKSTLASNGADYTVSVKRDEFNARDYASIIEKIAKEKDVFAVFMAGTLDGKDISAYVAYKLDTVAVTDAQLIEIEEDILKFTSPTYGATVLTESKINSDKIQVATIRAGSFEKKDNLNENAIEEEVEIEKEETITNIKNVFEEAKGSISLEDAEIIVTCGRGASKGEGYELVNDLANILNAPISGTRPVIDDGILPKTSQIGQSGKIVAPKLYIGCGVSGSVQHVSGIQSSNFIIAINKDEDAPIFNISDIGIVGDCEKILPIFNEEVKKIISNK
ncbi:electron transfer flavoprotein subunit alpha/FixB family protein [Peptoniphilus asaccharolyticus]